MLPIGIKKQLNNLGGGFPPREEFKLGDFLDTLTPLSATGLIVFQPGGVASDVLMTTWEDVEAAIAARPNIPLTLYVFDNLAPAVVPATASTDLQGRVTLRGTFLGTGNTPMLSVADGGYLRNVTQVFTLQITGTPTAQPFIVQDLPAVSLLLREGAEIGLGAGATAPAVDVLASVIGTQVTSALSGQIVSAAGAGQSIVRLASGISCISVGLGFVGGGPGPWYPPQTFEGDATTSVFSLHDNTTRPDPPTLFLGSFVVQPFSAAALSVPSAGATGSRPLGAALGEMFFDTTVGFPVWWTGALWVDASGTPA